MAEIDKEIVESFWYLFRGRTDAWGSVEGRSNKETVSIANYEEHLQGSVSLGVYPLLDDGTCHFFGVDLDEKNLDKARAIRQELAGLSIHAYIAQSKSKGFHIYGFADDVFIARDIRKVLKYILDKLGIKAEVFPKQDALGPDLPLGNYINLPCFGSTRPFLTGDGKAVPLKTALGRIKGTPQEAIDNILKALPKKRPKAPSPEKAECSDNELAVKKLLGNCAFIQHCQDNAATLGEPFWWSMIHNLVFFNEPGSKKIHELSEPYPGYSKEETDKKIKEAEKVTDKEVGPHTCLFIEQELGFDCPGDCLAKKMKIKAPAGLAAILVAQELRGPYLYRDKSGWHLNIERLVDDLLTEYHFKTMRDNEECLVYEDSIYSLQGEAKIREECEKRVSRKFMTTHSVNEVIGHIKRSTYVKRAKFNNEKWVLNLENGLYNIETSELSPHTPEFLSTIRIPVTYDPDADCPVIQQFFTEVLVEEDIPVIEELFGYCLVPDYKIQRAFLFTGDGANGKSTLLELLKHFIGSDNCTNLSLQDIVGQRFAVASLFGKLVNIYADIPSTKMESVGLFKTLTGGDTVRGEKKYRDDFFFNNYARLVFSTNKPPWVNEDTLAFWRRWIMINFPIKFEGDAADIGMLDRLITPRELSGLLNVALQGLKRLLGRRKYSYKYSPEEIAEKYRKSADITFAFIEDICEPDPDAWVPKDNLYDAFVNYCSQLNLAHMGKEAFGRKLKNSSEVHIKSRQRRVDGTQTWGWEGIQLAETQKGDIDMEV